MNERKLSDYGLSFGIKLLKEAHEAPGKSVMLVTFDENEMKMSGVHEGSNLARMIGAVELLRQTEIPQFEVIIAYIEYCAGIESIETMYVNQENTTCQ